MEGDISFGTQALKASEVPELTIPVAFQSPALAQELANLRDMLKDQGDSKIIQGDDKSDKLGHPQTPHIELPPLAFVKQLLKSLGDGNGAQHTLYLLRKTIGLT